MRREHLDTFEHLTADLPYRPKAVFPSEMFLFYCWAKVCAADHIIESGVGFGGSTSYLARLFPNIAITCIDNDRYGQLEAVARNRPREIDVLRGDSAVMLPKAVQGSKGSSLAVLIDGPKGRPAVDLAMRALSDAKVKVVAVHDLAFEPGAYEIDSHDRYFRDEFGFLDDKVGAEARAKHPNGPGLSIFRA
jgi:predicted O-methyltransferase YrrM